MRIRDWVSVCIYMADASLEDIFPIESVIIIKNRAAYGKTCTSKRCFIFNKPGFTFLKKTICEVIFLAWNVNLVLHRDVLYLFIQERGICVWEHRARNIKQTLTYEVLFHMPRQLPMIFLLQSNHNKSNRNHRRVLFLQSVGYRWLKVISYKWK